jgi:hypothetical protein
MKRALGILLLGLAACPASDESGDDTDTDTVETDDTDTVPDAACAALVDRTFASVEEGECGLGTDGPSMCTWHVSFTATTWTWQHSDYGADGTYTCADGVISAEGTSAPGSASYDPVADQLTWDGVVYE